MTSRKIVSLGLAALLVAGLVTGYLLWWSRPTAFGGVGSGFISDQTVATMHPLTATMAFPEGDEPETVTVTGVRARVRDNSADARISFAVCRLDTEPFIVSDGPAKEWCTTVDDVEGRTIRLSDDEKTTITMTVTPRHAGRVSIAGMDVAYRRGAKHLWRTGTQLAGMELKIHVAR